jgi:hypothetical protein
MPLHLKVFQQFIKDLQNQDCSFSKYFVNLHIVMQK